MRLKVYPRAFMVRIFIMWFNVSGIKFRFIVLVLGYKVHVRVSLLSRTLPQQNGVRFVLPLSKEVGGRTREPGTVSG